ncbi:MAG: hypothetical protein FK733_04100, partial [Asgard group archaeon]|nr:hypothetical protein [Asgard group archaeon]
MTRKSKTLFKENPYVKADAVNPEGFPAFKLPKEKLLHRLFHTGTIENTFYQTAKAQMELLLTLLNGFSDIETLAKLVLSGRTEGFMRMTPLVGMAYLMDHPVEASKIFNEVVITGNDLIDLINIRKGLGKGLGRAKKNMIRSWLKSKLTEYYAIKYPDAIIDAINLTRVSETDVREWFDEDKQLQDRVI